MFSTYLAMNGWHEALARIMDGIPAVDNVSPPWLVNPATRRRLKLDRYYEEVGLAVRFVGLTAKGQKRQSDWEELEDEQRDQTRAELCRANGVQLVTINPHEDPVQQMEGLVRGLSRSSRLLAQAERPAREKQKWMPLLSAARSRSEELLARVRRNPEQVMATLAESWRDREAGLAAPPETAPNGAPARRQTAPRTLRAEQRVRHTVFGEGVITAVHGEGDEATVSILFDGAQQRTFLAGLVGDKLEVLN